MVKMKPRAGIMSPTKPGRKKAEFRRRSPTKLARHSGWQSIETYEICSFSGLKLSYAAKPPMVFEAIVKSILRC
jgi:hypothetical protein